MNPQDEWTDRQLEVMCDAIRLLGMRGELHRHHGPFVPIVERHARAVDAAEFHRLMNKAAPDRNRDAAALAALARRSPGFQEEFNKAEARRFRLCDQPDLDEFAQSIRETLARIRQSRVVALQMEDRARLEDLRRHIPDGQEPSGPRWRKEGLELHARALVEAREAIEGSAEATRNPAEDRERLTELTAHAAAQRRMLTAVGEKVALLPEMHASTARIETCVDRRRRASAANGRRGGRPRKDEDLYDPNLVMKAIHRRVQKRMKQLAAVHEVCEEYRLRGEAISTTAETLARQYRTWVARRGKRKGKG